MYFYSFYIHIQSSFSNLWIMEPTGHIYVFLIRSFMSGNFYVIPDQLQATNFRHFIRWYWKDVCQFLFYKSKFILLTPSLHPGWFARDPVILSQVGRILLQLPDVDLARPSQIIIAEDCFQLSSIPNNRVSQVLVKSVEKLFGGQFSFTFKF